MRSFSFTWCWQRLTTADGCLWLGRYDKMNTGQINYVQFNNKVGDIIHPSETGALMFGSGGQTSAQLASWVEAKFAKVRY